MNTEYDISAKDTRLISLVGVSHGWSHFYQLSLPPLFWFIHTEDGLSYFQLGMLVTAFYVCSGVFQPAAGFIVDRFGPRRVLYAGIAAMAVGTALLGLVLGFYGMLLAAIIAGMGNAVFHPADFTILSHNVSEQRVGRAFGIHAFVGFLGYAVAPMTMLWLADNLGWRAALVVAGAAGLVFLMVLRFLDRGELEVQVDEDSNPKSSVVVKLGTLLTLPIIACFLFFLATAMAQIGLQTFSPAALLILFETPKAVGSVAVTLFLFATAFGVLGGGVLADRSTRHHIVAMVCLGVPALLSIVPGYVQLSTYSLYVVFVVIGVGLGLSIPARDMLVRALAPASARGRVFGFVYAGLDVGSAVTPAVFGWLLDHGYAPWIFMSLGVFFVCAMLAAAFAAAPYKLSPVLSKP